MNIFPVRFAFFHQKVAAEIGQSNFSNHPPILFIFESQFGIHHSKNLINIIINNTRFSG